MHDALAARSSQPGDGALPSPPTPVVMSEKIPVPSGAVVRVLSPRSITAVAGESR
jgi:hypothetical protein